MSRALLIILAILSVVLAAVLNATLLYFVAVALVVIAAGLWLFRMKGKFDVGKPDSIGYTPVGEEDLSSFGILEIRPKARNGEAAATAVHEADEVRAAVTDRPDSAEREHIQRESETVGREVSGPVTVAKAVRRMAGGRFDTFTESNHRWTSRYQMISVTEERDAHVLGPCLESLASAIGANTAALISSRDSVYRVVGIVSQNAYARGAGVLPVTSEAPLKCPRKGSIKIEDPATAKWNVADLKYYRGEIAVKEVARVHVPVSSEDERVVLLVDAVRKGTFDTPQSKGLLTQYAQLFGTLLEAETRGGLRPRKEIIAEEIESARSAGHPLALALVLYNGADELADPEAMAEAEAELIGRLSVSAEGLRVERFGDLMVGVFHRSDVDTVEDWAAHIQADLGNRGGTHGGVSVGVAIMTDRHETPESLRSDAAAALQEAVESGACTILE